LYLPIVGLLHHLTWDTLYRDGKTHENSYGYERVDIRKPERMFSGDFGWENEGTQYQNDHRTPSEIRCPNWNALSLQQQVSIDCHNLTVEFLKQRVRVNRTPTS